METNDTEAPSALRRAAVTVFPVKYRGIPAAGDVTVANTSRYCYPQSIPAAVAVSVYGYTWQLASAEEPTHTMIQHTQLVPARRPSFM
ncbi:unnamed protein product [Gadus morhua 'NCC']